MKKNLNSMRRKQNCNKKRSRVITLEENII